MQIGTEQLELQCFPALSRIIAGLLAVWPDHEKFLLRSCRDRDAAMLASTDRIAGMILDLAGDDLPGLCADYRWMCERLQDEEIDFRRTGRYRHSSFAEVEQAVYAQSAFMTRYINGLLLSQIVWFNHAAVIDLYLRRFLPETPAAGRLLEIGPGHGLMLCLAAADGRMASLAGWDISPTSIELTRTALRRLNVAQPVELAINDVLQPADGDGAGVGGAEDRFDAVVLCEVLEHLETPDAALAGLRRLMAPGARLFVSVPVNSPAPDHIHLLRTPEEAVTLVERNGFGILDARFYPIGGYTLERARRLGVTISCALIAERSAD